jgi:CTP synthase
MPTKHIFVTGGVVSSLGKGITAASLAFLLERRGWRVAMQKLDPYFNVDPGTMSPCQHGEVFVTADGAETDLDLGHYERIAGIPCTRESNFTSGRIYSAVIARERAGGYLGATVQLVPHVTDEIVRAFRTLHRDGTDIAISEIGGTIGDIESLPFLEAARQFSLASPPGDTLFLHLTLVPFIRAAGEIKTKPSQQSVAALRGIGIAPDILVCRTERSMAPGDFRKLSLFCNVPERFVLEEKDVSGSIYEVPMEMEDQGLAAKVLEKLGLPDRPVDWTAHRAWLAKTENPSRTCTVALVGKYVSVRDAYKSIHEALAHAGFAEDAKVEVLAIDSEELEHGDPAEILKDADAILVPGGFGSRGIPGKIAAATWAMERKIPFLGICLGMQCAVVAFARRALGWSDADSTEFNSGTTHPVVDLLPSQRHLAQMGGTMRLGSYPCRLAAGSRARELYGEEEISERHRHRYEFNNDFRRDFEEAGLVLSGVNPREDLVELVELPEHPYFLACQFHPEFQSRPTAPHPLFRGLVAAALARTR